MAEPEQNLALVARLRSFKPGGKWMDDWEVSVPGTTRETPIFMVWDIVRQMYAAKLSQGVLIEVVGVPEHPHDHPVLLKQRTP